MYTYAQNFEDVILSRLFEGKDDGFYIDVGAHDPDFLSVTKHFYEIGWSGINIEPLRDKHLLFEQNRPRDINIHAAIGDGHGRVRISGVVDCSSLSTTNENRRAELQGSIHQLRDEEVELVSLNQIIDYYQVKKIDFLKIDVEGDEARVLKSIDLSKHRPIVIVVESVRPSNGFPGWSNYDPVKLDSSQEWLQGVLSNRYIEAYFDGLNKFFIRDDHSHLLKRLHLPPGVFDYIVPSILDRSLSDLEKKEQVIQAQELEIHALNGQLSNLHEEVAQQLKAIHAYRMAYGGLSPLGPLVRLIRRSYSVIRPRLGQLSQYVARPLIVHRNRRQRALSIFPRISIVTPSYQQGDYIERTIQSVLDQSYPKLQYFVQDGGSSDSTVTVLKQYEDELTGWKSEKDAGQSQAINLGFAHTDGEIMAWLNSDDLLLPGALHTIADYFNNHPDVDVVYGNRLLIDEDDMEIGRWILPGHDSDVLSWADYVPQETLFWRRRIWEKVGGKIDESFRFAMDWDLLVRFRDAGAKFGHIPQFLGAFRIHERQKTSAAINEIGYQEMNRIRERILGRVPDRNEVRRAVLPYLVKHIAVDMVFRVKKRMGWKV